ncbi:MAG: hypothetical protein HY701_02315 [Gemmatimonadetes bacterium]|nr:hypothetical protein [Gemmatimonadota bacterium]
MRQPHVLLVEHDSVLRQILCEALAEEGFAVSAHRSIADALTSGPEPGTDLILADVWGVASEALQEDQRAQVEQLAAIAPIVLLTAHRWTERDDPAALGAAAVVYKPFDLDTLVTALRTVLGGRGSG